MLKVYGNVYSDKNDTFAEIVKALEAYGFKVAYNYENSGVIEKEVSSLTEDNNESENQNA